MAMTVMACAAVIAAGASVYSAMNQPGSPDIPPPPPPASAYEFDEDGNATTIQVWDAEKNAYITKKYPEPEEPINPSNSGMTDENFKETDEYKAWAEKHQAWEEGKEERAEEKQARDGLRTKMLDNLNQTPEDRMQAYDDYATNMSTSMHKEVDEAYDKRKAQEEEAMNRRGMFGSKAYADTMSDLREEKGEIDTDIALKADLAKESLADADRKFWLGTLAEIDAGQRADVLTGLQESNLVNQKSAQGTSGLAAMYGINSNNMMNKWQGEIAANNMRTKTFSDTATGLAFLYGYNKGGGLTTTPARANPAANFGTSGAFSGGSGFSVNPALR
jgi:hypothetical protein